LEAIQLTEDLGPNLILIDIQLPILDGLEAMRCLRKNPGFVSMVIIAPTTLSCPATGSIVLRLTSATDQSKPVSPGAPARLIAGLLGRAE